MKRNDLLTIAATPHEIPTSVELSRWPVHVTLAGNFSVDETSVVSDLIPSIVDPVAPFDVILGLLHNSGQNTTFLSSSPNTQSSTVCILRLPPS